MNPSETGGHPQRVYIGKNVEIGQSGRIEGATMKATIDNRADIGYGAVEPDVRNRNRADSKGPR